MRPNGGAAILLGAVVGVGAAFAHQSQAPTGPLPPPTRPVPATSPAPAPQASTPLPSRPASSAATASLASAPGAASALGVPSAEPSPTPSAEGATVPSPSADASSVAPAFPLVTPRPPLATAAEVERAEISCYATDPEDCGRAATAYADGALVPRDRARAEKLRKIEFTRLTRRCEQRSPHACLVLAGRSYVGDGVAKDERRANALLKHARELCHRMTTPECVDGEPK